MGYVHYREHHDEHCWCNNLVHGPLSLEVGVEVAEHPTVTRMGCVWHEDRATGTGSFYDSRGTIPTGIHGLQSSMGFHGHETDCPALAEGVVLELRLSGPRRLTYRVGEGPAVALPWPLPTTGALVFTVHMRNPGT